MTAFDSNFIFNDVRRDRAVPETLFASVI